jgi:ATP-dependent DNA ligase
MKIDESKMTLAKAGAEGVMLRHPDATGYAAGRSENLLRMKFLKN